MAQSTTVDSIPNDGLDDQELEGKTLQKFNDEINQLDQTIARCTGRLKELENTKKAIDAEEEHCGKRMKNILELIENEKKTLEKLNHLLTTNEHRQEEIDEEIAREEINLNENEIELFDESDEIRYCIDIYNMQKIGFEQEKKIIECDRQLTEEKIRCIQQHIMQLKGYAEHSMELMDDNKMYLTSVENGLDDIHRRIEANQKELNDFEEKLDVLEDQLLMIKREWIQLHSELSRIIKLIERIKEIIKCKEEQTDNLQKDNAVHEDQLQRVEQAREVIWKNIEQLTKQINEKKETLQSLKAELKETLKTRSTQKQQICLANETTEPYKQYLRRIDSEYGILRNGEQQINQQLEGHENEYCTVEQIIMEKIEQMEQIIKEKIEQMKQLRDGP